MRYRQLQYAGDVGVRYRGGVASSPTFEIEGPSFTNAPQSQPFLAEAQHMPSPIPLSPHLVRAACDLHATLVPWHWSDEALLKIKAGVPGFSPPATLAKVASVNALYYTNVFALVRVAEHFSGVLAMADLGTAGPELVDALADVPRGGTEQRKVRRLSLAAKFAHFFIDEDRFPIYDRYAVRMVAKHAGTSVTSLDGNFTAFTAAFNALATRAGIFKQRRRLDRYLWIQGQYEEWTKRGKASSGDLELAIERRDWPPPS